MRKTAKISAVSDGLPDKSLGQHWLEDGPSLEAMADAIGLMAGDNVLEIGPGQGSLTDVLLARGASVWAVEFDPELYNRLVKKYQDTKIKLIHQDILQFDFNQLPKDYKVAANIPYYLTSNLLRLLNETTNSFSQAALLVQKEVAERAAANPGQMSLLSVGVQYYCQTSLGRKVPADLFWPPPKVDSQILVLNRRVEPLFKDLPPRLYFRVVRSGFSQRRKTLLNSLSGGLAIDKVRLVELVNGRLDLGRRPQDLSLEDWYLLAQQLRPVLTS